jgi:hypothetical protein
MSKRASSSTSDNTSKKRRTRLHAITVSTSSESQPSARTRHVRLTQTNNRLTQRRSDSKASVHQLPVDGLVVEPDDAIDEWVNEDEDENTPADDAPSVKVPAPRKRQRKSNSASRLLLL